MNGFRHRLANTPVLETRRLRLRRMTVGDAPAIFSYARLPRVALFTAWPHHRASSETEAFLEDWTAGYATGEVRDWAITTKVDGCLIGTGGFTSFDSTHGNAELGYVLHPDHWGQGYATEVVRACLDWGWESSDLRRVTARCFAGNRASANVLRKSGFEREGVIRQGFRKEGIPVDVHLYGQLRSDPSGVHTRVATATDLDAIEIVIRDAFQYDPATGKPIGGCMPEELDLFRGLRQEETLAEIHVLDVGGTTVGFIAYTEGRHLEHASLRVGALTIMGVHPFMQRRGLGQRLLEWSVAQVESRYDVLMVVGHPSFYARVGFVPANNHGLRFALGVPDHACLVRPRDDTTIPPGTIAYPDLVSTIC